MTIADGEDVLASDILDLQAIATAGLNSATNAGLAADAAQATADAALPLAGGQMIGPLLLAADPLAALEAATKAYVDTKPALGGPYLPLGGGALSGPLVLNSDPAGDLWAATKQYVDNRPPLGGPYLPLIGGHMTGPIMVDLQQPLIVSANPVLPPAVPGSNFRVLGADGQNSTLAVETFGSVGQNPVIVGRRSFGTSAAQLAVTADRVLLNVGGAGFTGTVMSSVKTALSVRTAENWSDAAQGTYLTFGTVPIGSTGVAVERMRITDAGVLLVGLTAPVGTELLQISNGVRAPTYRVGASATGPTVTSGTGAPAGAAPVASLFLRSDGSAGQQIYVNQDGASGWAPMPSGGPYLPLAGGVMVGPITLQADPAAAMQPATRQYVDARGPYLPLSGGAMTGPIMVAIQTPLIISANPVLPGGAPGTNLRVLGADAQNATISVEAFGNNPIITGRRADGTSAVPTTPPANAVLLNVGAAAWAVTGLGGLKVGMAIRAAEAWNDTAQGTYVAFYSALIGATAVAERMRIGSDIGAVLVGMTVRDGTELLQVSNGIRAPSLRIGSGTGPTVTSGTGAPVASAPVASLFLRSDGPAGQQIYLNTDGINAWVPVPFGGPYLPLAGGQVTGPITIPSQMNPLVVSANPFIPAGSAATVRLLGADTQNATLQVESYGNNANVIGARINGTSALPAAVTTDLVLLNLAAKGWTGTVLSPIRVGISLRASENWSDAAQGMHIIFSSTLVGTLTATERMRLHNAGALLIGITAPDGTDLLQATSVRSPSVRIGTSAGPTITTGTGIPATTAPAGSIFIRSDGAAGSRLYVNQAGAATWAPIAAV